jgi:phospholipase A2-like protein
MGAMVGSARQHGRDRGAQAVQYGALLLLLSGIVAAVLSVGVPRTVSAGYERVICTIFGGEDCGTPVAEPSGGGGDQSGTGQNTGGTGQNTGGDSGGSAGGETSGGVGGGAGGGGGGSAGTAEFSDLAGHPIRDYLTGDAPVPDDFDEVMGYVPERVETPYGVRMIDPGGECSSPTGNTGRSFDFTFACKTHDLAYDLLRYNERRGLPHNPEARRAADDQFREDMFGHCGETRSGFNEWTCKNWAGTYHWFVARNSDLQHHGVP